MIGTIFHNRYEILEKLGDGGTSIVYKAKDVLLNRLVTIKILRDSLAKDSEFVNRFKNEAKSVASLSHPNIVSIYDVVFTEDSHYLVMEYVEGCSLKDFINYNKDKNLPIDICVKIQLQILDALEHAHNNNIIHRDIKPHNILIDKNLHIKVTDFGIAMALSDMTQNYSKDVVGSVHYMSPEQVDNKILTTKSDIYSSAVVFYELLTGELPFKGDTAVSVAMQHVKGDIIPPHKLRSDIPIGLSAVVMRGLRKDPDLRYATAEEMGKHIIEQSMVKPLSTNTSQQWEEEVNQKENKVQEEIITNYNEKSNEPPKQQNNNTKALKIGLIIVAIIAVIGIGVLIGSSFMGDKDTDIPVPQLQGLSLEEAQFTLSELGLVYEIVSVNDDEIPENQVISQSIPSGQNVKEGRVITLHVSKGPKTLYVPDVTGMEEREASLLLKNNLLLVEVHEITDESAELGTVALQEPVGGSQIETNKPVIIYISTGKEIQMPNVVGLTKSQAEAKLNSVKLKAIITEKESTEKVEGIVLTQNIQEGTKILEGQTVNLEVSLGPGPMASKARVTYNLPLTDSNHVIEIVVMDNTGTHTEYKKTHHGGDEIVYDVPFYGNGKIRILLDGEEVYSQDV